MNQKINYDDYKKILKNDTKKLSLAERNHYYLPKLKYWDPRYLEGISNDDFLMYFICLTLSEKLKMLDFCEHNKKYRKIFLLCLNYKHYFNYKYEEYILSIEPYEQYLSEDNKLFFLLTLIRNKKREITELSNYPEHVIEELSYDIYNKHKAWLRPYLTSYIQQQKILKKSQLCLELSKYDTFFQENLLDELSVLKNELGSFYLERGEFTCSKKDIRYPILLHIKPLFELEQRMTIFNTWFNNFFPKNVQHFVEVEEMMETWIPEHRDAIMSITHTSFNAFAQINLRLNSLKLNKAKDAIFEEYRQNINNAVPNVLRNYLKSVANNLTELTGQYTSEREINAELCKILFLDTLPTLEVPLII